MMKRLLMLIPSALVLAALPGGVQAGLLDELFEITTTKNPDVYGRIVWKETDGTPARLAVQTDLPPAPGAETKGGEAAPAEPITLYPNVRYKDLHNVHPCAVKMIVQVKDPCAPKPCGCCRPEPKCVFVEICVPPSGCRKIEISRDGSEVEYDYGHYEVEIKSKNGVIVVDYDD